MDRCWSRPVSRRPSRSRSNDDGRSEGLALPPEIWAGVCEYLPFQTVLSCAATSRTMLHDAMPLVTTLHIDKASEINIAIVSRFRDVRDIHINSLLTSRVDHGFGFGEELRMVVDVETKIRVLPFLTMFRSLEQVFFGGEEARRVIRNVGEFSEGGFLESMQAFIDLISGAYRSGAFSQDVKVFGLFCPDCTAFRTRSSNCETCLRACRSFPLKSVLCFEHGGSSIEEIQGGRSFGLDVCLEKAQIESIIEGRPGGRASLCSKDHFLGMLGRGRRYQINPPSSDIGAESLYIVKYTDRQLEEIKSVIQYAKHDVKELSPQKVTDAIMRSFAAYDGASVLPKRTCFLSETSLRYLKDEIGLPLNEEELIEDVDDLMYHADEIVSVVIQWCGVDEDQGLSHPTSAECDDIVSDCLRMTRRCLSEGDPSIFHISVESMVESLVDLLRYDELQLEASISLKSIFLKGTSEQKKAALRAGAILSLVHIFTSSNETFIVEEAMYTLGCVAYAGMLQNITEMTKTKGFFDKLVSLLGSSDETSVELSLMFLLYLVDYHKGGGPNARPDTGMERYKISVIQAETHTQQAISAGVLRRLTDIDKPLLDREGLIHIFSDLLRKVLMSYNGSLLEVINSPLVPNLVGILRKTVEAECPTDPSAPSDIVANLAIEACDRNLPLGPLQEEDFIRALVDLVKWVTSPCLFFKRSISEAALIAIGKIVTRAPASGGHIARARFSKSVTRLLKRFKSLAVIHQCEIERLRTASHAFSKCCCSSPAAFVAEKDSWSFLRCILTCKDEATLSNSCWALYHLLEWLTANKAHNFKVNKRPELTRRLVKLLSKDSFDGQEPALKALCLLSATRDIISYNGLLYMKKMLQSSHGCQELVCRVISNIISENSDGLQEIVKADIFPCLLQVILVEKKVKAHTMQPIYLAAETGTTEQINYLASLLRNEHLRIILFENPQFTDNSIHILTKILEAGKDSASLIIQMIESKLQEWHTENMELKRELRFIEVLERKKAWLEFNLQDKQVKSLQNALELLMNRQASESFENKNVSNDYIKLRNKICQAKARLWELRVKAEETGPDKELCGYNLPSDVEAGDRMIIVSMSQVSSIKWTRASNQRKKDIKAVLGGLKNLLRAKSTRNKRLLEVEDESTSLTSKRSKATCLEDTY